ncbi:dense granular GRA10 [Babesia ovis]|uniref:Dense granular GRA10 n=1 Tax=Babesia ovis TaxID=5869 RepID=A0A9W5WVM4_BABOV|nr:dense granular GRA10 [Babesia ovis]
MVSTGGVVFYRFGSERGIWRELQLDSSGGILVSDLKILIAQEISLSKEFTRKTNLTVCLYDENSSEEPKPLDDNVVIHVGSRVLLNRVAWVQATPIFHEARTQFEGAVTEERQNLRPFPVSLICKLCGLPMTDPVLIKCSANCGYSGCCACVMSHFKDSVIKNEEGVETHTYTLAECKSCPFCTRGLVSCFIHNRQMAAVLLELDFSNFDIPTFNPPSEANATVEIDPVVNNIVSLPKHFLVCVDNMLIAAMREHMLLPIYIDSLLSPASETNRSQNSNTNAGGPTPGDTSVIVLSYVGGGTSLSPMGVVRVMEEDRTNMEFIKSARAHTARKFEWLHNNTLPLLVPARRQPLFAYFGAKRFSPIALNNQHDVMWRYRSDLTIEVGLTRKAFDLAFEAVFGVQSEGIMTDVENINKSWLEVAFPGGPPPMYIDREGQIISQNSNLDDLEVDRGNPYMGYAAILPFLSESQFLKLRDMQRLAKEEFLQQFTDHVVNHMPSEEGEKVLEKAYNNVWKRHIDYQFPSSESSAMDQDL